MATIFITPPPPNQSSSKAVNLFPDTPRISFSYNLDHLPSPDHHHVARSDQNLSSNDPDFDFDFRLPDCQLGQEASPADDLFFNGVLLPTHIKPRTPNPAPPLEPSISKKDDLAEEEQGGVIVTTTKASLIREERGQSKSFWRFMRSTSLNCDGRHCKKGSIWSSLPLLARSNSTGHGKLHSSSSNISSNHRQSSKLSSPSSGSGSSTRFHHKPPLRKAQFSGSGNSSPVFSVPPPYITKGTSDLLGLGSFFRGGNTRKGKKP